MIWLLLATQAAWAQSWDPGALVDKVHSARAEISATEKAQREALKHLFEINRNIKELAKRNARLSEKMLNQEANVRALAQDVQELETRSKQYANLLNRRLRQLYQERGENSVRWLFSARAPVEAEKHHRFLRLMIDSDHKHLKRYLATLRERSVQRGKLKGMVEKLARMQKDMKVKEEELALQIREKSKALADLKNSRDSQLRQLKNLRDGHSELKDMVSYAFFERRGALRPPIEGHLAREYGTYVDPVYRYRLMHKGQFYSAPVGSDVKALFGGKVVWASILPGYGQTLILDHGDNYYSVYAFASQIKVRKGREVREGDLLAKSGVGSSLFGPGLYFEIRHFTDAIDPRSWIKESFIKTAKAK